MLFIQIIKRSPHTKDTHWLAVSNINFMEDEVGIYDSAFDNLPHNEQPGEDGKENTES